MFVPKVAFTLFALAGLGANLFASARSSSNHDLGLDARSLDEDYEYSSFARRSAEPKEYYGTSYLSRRGMDDEDLDFGLFGRDAEPDLDLETALLRRDIITAVDSMLMRRGNNPSSSIYPSSGGKHAGSGSKIPVPHKGGIYPQSGGSHAGKGSVPGMDNVLPSSSHGAPLSDWKATQKQKPPTKIPGPAGGSNRKSKQ